MQQFFNLRTDLAIEAREMVSRQVTHEIPGVEVVTSQDEDVLITRVGVKDAAAQEIIGKPAGNYVTIEAQGLRDNDPALRERISHLLAEELKKLLPEKEQRVVLVVGLGNRNVTPDALGPKVVESILVTRHLKDWFTDEIKEEVCSVCAIAPGVLGITGMETTEIIQGVVEKIRPNLVIAVDALAAASSQRIHTTLQLADTGIHPGSGVGNKRFGLNEQTLGVPVVAIGVPTVIHASTIAMDTIQTLKQHAAFARYFKSLETLSEADQHKIVRQILPESLGNLMVTPKEVDRLIEDIAKVVAGGINEALHPKVSEENLSLYLKF